jgi:hypothetical protein
MKLDDWGFHKYGTNKPLFGHQVRKKASRALAGSINTSRPPPETMDGEASNPVIHSDITSTTIAGIEIPGGPITTADLLKL